MSTVPCPKRPRSCPSLAAFCAASCLLACAALISCGADMLPDYQQLDWEHNGSCAGPGEGCDRDAECNIWHCYCSGSPGSPRTIQHCDDHLGECSRGDEICDMTCMESALGGVDDYKNGGCR